MTAGKAPSATLPDTDAAELREAYEAYQDALEAAEGEARRIRERARTAYVAKLEELHAAGWTWTACGVALGLTVQSVNDVRRIHEGRRRPYVPVQREDTP